MAKQNGEGHGNGAADPWVIEIDNEFKRNLPSFGDVSIYRVPKIMKASMEEAYAPQVVAFGPYNRTINQRLSAMDKHKIDAVRRTLSRMNNVTIDELIARIANLESKIRDCYQGSIECKGKGFAWMFTMDACFILEFLRTNCHGDLQEPDPEHASLVFQRPDAFNGLKSSILADIMKLENQIPFFILRSIIELERQGSNEAVPNLSEILASVFTGLPPFPMDVHSDQVDAVTKDDGSGEVHNNKAYHLLDIWRKIIERVFTTSDEAGNISWIRKWMPKAKPRNNIFTPSAVSLQNVGIKFEQSKDRKRKVSFERNMWLRRSKLFLPEIAVTPNSVIYMRNLLAFEECQKSTSPSRCVISSVVMLMDSLINTQKDVAVLTEAEILSGTLVGSEEAIADRFNKVCTGVTLDPDDDVLKVREPIRDYYCNPFNRCITQFKEEFFSKPWYTVSAVAATAALVMTAMQTYYSAKTYSDDHK